MFNFVPVVSVALAAAAAVSGLVIPRTDVPSTYDSAILEPYAQYNARYLALDCQDQHNTTFFDDCCHPMKTGETLATARKPYCDPANASSIVSSAAATATATDDDDEDCTDDSAEFTPSSTSPVAVATTAEPVPSSVFSSATAAEATVATTPAVINVAGNPNTETSTTPSSTTPTPTPTPTPTSDTIKASIAVSSTASSSSSETHSGGVATFFYQNGVAGACGTVHSDSDFIAAMDQDLYGNSGNASPLCGKQVKITRVSNGATVTVTVADDCPTCNNSNSIDLSEGAFKQIATEAEGEVDITWEFL